MRGLALSLSLVLLAGCGGEKEKPEADGKDSSASEPDPTTPGNEEPAPDPGYQAAQVGQCFSMKPAQSRASVASSPRVRCKGPHNTVVAYVVYVPRAVTPRTPLAKRQALGKRVCEPAYRRLVGGTLADRATSILTWTLFTPGQAQLERGARWVRCDVLARSDDQLIPLPAGKSLLASGVPEQLRVCQSDTGVDISCSQPHAFRLEAVFLDVGNAYPDATRYTPVARDRCKELMGKYGGYWQAPSRSGWRSGDRFIRCLSPSA